MIPMCVFGAPTQNGRTAFVVLSLFRADWITSMLTLGNQTFFSVTSPSDSVGDLVGVLVGALVVGDLVGDLVGALVVGDLVGVLVGDLVGVLVLLRLQLQEGGGGGGGLLQPPHNDSISSSGSTLLACRVKVIA